MHKPAEKSGLKSKLKQLLLAWVMVLVFALPVAGVVLTRPQPALAQGAPTLDVANLTQNLGKFIKDVVLEGLKQGAGLAFKNALKVFVSQIAYDTAVWIGSGDENQKPLLYTKDVGSYLIDLGDAAAGEFLNTLFSENGYFEYDLCKPLDVDVQLYLNLAIGIAIPQSDYSTSILGIQLPEAELPTVECTFSEITENFQDASLDVDFASQVAVLFLPTNNDFGVYSTAVGTGYELTADQGDEAVINRLKGDFTSVDGKVSDYIATPGSAVEHQYFLSLDASSYPQTTYTGQLLADTIDIFTSTLISKLLERLKTGLISDFTTPDIAESLSGSSSTAGGVSAAEEKYLTFKEIPITRGGDTDILSDLANCPDQGREVTNCVIDEGFRSAIEQGKTVQQALDEGLIDGGKPFGFGEGGIPIESPEEGIQYRSTIILKHYRIVPVGWQIAAEYLRDFGGGSSVTLQDLVDAYDQCDSTGYSPYCKLVDPDWVLTSPAGICNLQGYSQNVLSVRFEDDDGLDSTPERSNILRSQSCVDDRSCLKTDSDGNCIAYGYCVEEKRIYRFQGDECPEQNSSCQTYEDSSGDEVSYLRNTLNFNNCDANSVGCQWYCTMYNEINLDWQCSQNGYTYETCSTTSSTYDSANGTCACTADDATTCDMQEGAFKCSTDAGTTCTLSEVADSAIAGQDSAINFNNQVSTCSEDDAGCTTFIQTTTGANLIFNSSFEYFNSFSDAPEDIVRGEDELTDTTFDTFGFYSADSSTPGEPCDADSGTEDCIGWEKTGRVYATSDDTYDGFVAAELEGVATLTYELEAGYTLGALNTLADRTFDLSFMSQNTGTTNCAGGVTLNGELLENLDYTGVSSANITYTGNNTWTTNTFEAYTYPSTTTATELSLHITVPNSCTSSVKFDAFDLTETDDSSDYTAYGTSEEISMNGDKLECAMEDIGCELYTPDGGTTADAVPGQITNPLSDACTGTDGFASASCSQCNGTTSDSEFVGCDFYQEQPLTNAAPVPSLDGFTTLPTGDERAGIVERIGYYCNNSGFEGESCYDDSDCGGTVGACVDSVSIIPSTADVCSAQYVGCEEYTNLDTIAEGGEGVEYYSYIRQCVKNTPEQRAGADGLESTTADNEVHTYVTFEGSDVSGYSLRSFDLKKSNLDNAPCTNLDLYGSTAQSSEADCIDDTTTVDGDGDGIYDGQGVKSCTSADLGVDPDCTEFIDPDTGTSYYRLKSYTITASDDCHPLRNTLDGRTYYSVPSESTSCPASQNLCREYKGSAGGDVFEAINEDFEDSVWDQSDTGGTVEQSSESTAAGGHSMHLTAAGAGYDLFTVGDEGTVSSLDEGKTYVLELWAKEEAGGGGLDIYFNSATSTSADASVYFVQNDVNSVSGDTVSLDDDWHKYTFGPVIMPRAGEEDDQLIIYWDDSTSLYVDNVVLEESDSQYLIKDTASLCTGYEGCEEYTDREGDTHYLKSFTRLCEEQYVGCEAILDTQNSDSPFTQEFNTDNDFTSSAGPDDDVLISEDQVVAFVHDEDNYCTESQAGCTEFGQPEIDETSGYADSFTSVTYLNDPDEYSAILCETDALSCDEYTSANDEIVYFKNPGDRTCEYRQETDGSDFNWFITGTDEECPLFDETASPGQPMGAMCDGGERDGLFCGNDDDCPDDDTTDTDEPHCRSDLSTDADTSGYPDTGWTGTCSTAYSGCTEYQDANTDNLVPNSSFEEDVYTWDAASSSTDETTKASDTVPDYFGYALFSCDTLVQNTSNSHTGSDSLQISQDGLTTTGDGIGCAVAPEEAIQVDTSATYTVSANIKVPKAYTAEARQTSVSVGLYMYGSDGLVMGYDFDGDGTEGDLDDFELFNYAAQAEVISSDEAGVWLRYQGEVGNRLDRTWPSVNNVWGEDVASVRPFVYVYTPSGDSVFVDNLSLTKNSSYYYINSSVDGATESEQNSCNGEVDIGDGCVAFRDVTNEDLTYLSVIEAETEVNSNFSVNPCTIGATETDDENCRFNPNTADGNVVLQVRPDRECNTWLSCLTASITTDSEGNEETTCLDIGGCDELSDSGLCSNSLGNEEPDDLSSSSDLTYTTSAGGTVKLNSILNLSGYSKVGVDWGDTDGTCASGVCEDGPNAGESCSDDDDCQENILIQGYYPYEDMAQEGEDGLNNGNEDLISDGDFEEVVCTGSSSGWLKFDGTATALENVFLASRDKTQRCTFDDQCRNPETEARLAEIQSASEQGTSVEYDLEDDGSYASFSSGFNYSQGWCDNPDSSAEGWGNFYPYGAYGDILISIIDYDPSVDYENPSTSYDGFSDAPLAGSATLDLNNVLYVQPDTSEAGVYYALGDESAIVNGNQYSLSFDASWAESYSQGTYLKAGMMYSDGTVEYFTGCISDGSCGHQSLEVTSIMDSFALTITPDSKPDDTYYVYIIITANSDTAFYVDNVSMLPVLEVNKNLSNIARECRAYPAENALECNYTESNGSVYTGIHGYCLEKDGLFRQKCVTWWPVDVISGDTDSRSKTAAGYSGRVNVWYCAVAKGLEDLAVCQGGERDGAICSGLSDSGEAEDYCQGATTETSECIVGTWETVSYYNNYTEGTLSNSDRIDGIGDYDNKWGGYQILPLRFAYSNSGSYDTEMVFDVIQSNNIQDILTLSDINELRLFIDSGDQDPGDKNGEWPLLGTEFSIDSRETLNNGSVDLDIDRVGIDADGYLTDPDDTSILIYDSDATEADFFNTYEDDNDYETGNGTDSGSYCKWTSNSIDETGSGEIKFVWTSRDGGDHTWTKGPSFCVKDPFNSTFWDNDSGWISDNQSFTSADSVEPSSYYTSGDSNVLGVRWTFTEGTLDHTAWLIYSGIEGSYLSASIQNFYDLNESCVLAVQTVTDEGETTAWLDRLTSSSTYSLPNTNYTYDSPTTPYGSINSSLVTSTDTPATVDGSYGLSSFASSNEGALMIIRESESTSTALPLACIGKCNNNMCSAFDVANPAYHGYAGENQACNSDESYSCSDEGGGSCMGVDGNGEFSTAGVVEGYWSDGTYGYWTDVYDYAGQLEAAALTAREDLSLIFAQPATDVMYLRDRTDDHLVQDSIGSFWENYDGEDIFEVMEECSGSRGSNEYCGIRPSVYSMEMNGQSGDVYLESGESVRFTFGSDGDDNQLPISNIRIMWEGMNGNTFNQDDDDVDVTNDIWDAAPSDEHIYSHSYTCDETSEYYQSADSADLSDYVGNCVYELRIQIEDHWDFCSGLQENDSYDDIRSADDGDCNSYDEFDGYIVVAPD